MNLDRFALDLTRYHFRREVRGFVIYGTWLVLPDNRPTVPCLAILPPHRISHDRSTPAVVPLNTAWAWSEEQGDPRHAARTTASFLQAMGMAVNPMSCMSLTMAIRDHLGDLISIPPRPGERRVVADAIRTDQDGRQHHAEITEAD